MRDFVKGRFDMDGVSYGNYDVLARFLKVEL